MLLPLGAAGYYLVAWAHTSPLFMLSPAQDILVDGNRYVSREEVLTALGLPKTATQQARVDIFRLSLPEKRKQVESIPWVRSASLTRVYPHRLAVSVVERAPVAYANVEGRLKLLDLEGVLLEKPQRAVFDFPVLMGLNAGLSPTERKLRLALYQDFEAQVAGEATRSGWLVSELDLSDSDDLKALLVQGHETLQVHFGNRDFLERFRNFLALLPELRGGIAKIDTVDLRYHNQMVVNPHPASRGAKRPQRPGGRRSNSRGQRE